MLCAPGPRWDWLASRLSRRFPLRFDTTDARLGFDSFREIQGLPVDDDDFIVFIVFIVVFDLSLTQTRTLLEKRVIVFAIAHGDRAATLETKEAAKHVGRPVPLRLR